MEVTQPMSLVDARSVAEELGVSREWVYRNAARIGAVKLSDSPNAPLRFDLERVRDGLNSVAAKDVTVPIGTYPPNDSRVPLLPVRGD